MLTEAARGNAAMGCCFEALRTWDAGASGGGAVADRLLVASLDEGGAFVDAARRAVAMPMRCPGRFAPS